MQESQPLLSVIVPVYNVQSYLMECVESIEAQTIADRQIILVDDGSTDNSGSVCDELAAKYSDIQVIHKKNGGLGSARNAGLDVAKGVYVGFVDSDDYIAPDMYEVLCQTMQEHSCEAACCNRYRHIEQNGEKHIEKYKASGICSEEIFSTREALQCLLLDRGLTYSACDKLFKRELFDTNRFPMNKLPSEDIPCIFHVLLECNHIAHIGVPKYYYRLTPGSITQDCFKKENISTFHYMQEVYAEICKSYTSLQREALFALIQSAGAVYSRMLDNEALKEFRDIEREIRKTIRHYLFRIIKNDYFTFHAKLVFIMISLRVYPLFYKIRRK